MELPTYHRGEWITRDDGRSADDTTNLDYEGEFIAAGWEKEHYFGPERHNCLDITLWGHSPGSSAKHPEDQPEFILSIHTGLCTSELAALDLVDAMDLLARWLPAVTAGAELDEKRSYNQASREQAEGFEGWGVPPT
jgi:hypothetical protein